MNVTLQATMTAEIGDMNGPLSYWGPVEGGTVTTPTRQPAAARTDLDALRQLGRTLHGRTWAGTNALMNALFAGTLETAAA